MAGFWIGTKDIFVALVTALLLALFFTLMLILPALLIGAWAAVAYRIFQAMT